MPSSLNLYQLSLECGLLLAVGFRCIRWHLLGIKEMIIFNFLKIHSQTIKMDFLELDVKLCAVYKWLKAGPSDKLM